MESRPQKVEARKEVPSHLQLHVELKARQGNLRLSEKNKCGLTAFVVSSNNKWTVYAS